METTVHPHQVCLLSGKQASVEANHILMFGDLVSDISSLYIVGANTHCIIGKACFPISVSAFGMELR